MSSVAYAAPPPRISEITYATVDGVELKLDYAIPEGDGPFPMVLCFHGGGFVIGDKADVREAVRALVATGYAAAGVQYRLAPRFKYPAAIVDAKCAVRYLRSRSKDFKLDTNRFATFGASAGGYLSLMVALTRSEDGFDTGPYLDQSCRVQAAVSYCAPTDLAVWKVRPELFKDKTQFGRDMELYRRVFPCPPQTGDEAVAMLTEATTGKSTRTLDELRLASPVTYVRKDSPPILTVHGTDDAYQPVEMARRLDGRMREAGATHELLILQGAEHQFTGSDLMRARIATAGFLAKYLRPTGPGR